MADRIYVADKPTLDEVRNTLAQVNTLVAQLNTLVNSNLDAKASSRQASWGATTTHRDRIDAAISSRASQATVNTINTNVGSNSDAASASGSLHAKMKDLQNRIGAGAGIKSVQRGVFAGSTKLNDTSPLTLSISAVDVNKSVLNVIGISTATSGSNNSNIRPFLKNATTIEMPFSRQISSTSGNITYYFDSFNWEVIEFY